MRDVTKQQPLALLMRITPSITGFSYPLQRLLIDRLEDLLREDKLFERGNTAAEEESRKHCGSTLTGVGRMVIEALGDSFGVQITESYDGIKQFIEDANMFLSTFEL